ncbi:MAG: hypothetical protein JNJ55_14535 [Betaproteobacteria bacterium]|nr:hypothetical protein [Betaproteobacteria bacterium]
MQLTQELTFHTGNIKDSLGKLKAYRPPKWVMFALVAFAFVNGWLGGWSRGMADHVDIEVFMRGAMMSAAANDRADGKPFLTERLYHRAADEMVRQHVQEVNANVLERINRLASPRYWTKGRLFDTSRREKDYVIVVRFAEQRLKLTLPPSDQTKRTLAELNRSWLLDSIAAEYVEVAANYSSLLGRQVRPEAFVSDVQIQEKISRIRNTN